MNQIQHKYGKITEPIYSVGAGYQVYFPRFRDALPHSVGTLRRDTMGKTDSQILYNQSNTGSRFNAQPVFGFYAGNRILSERYRDDQAGFLSKVEADSMVANFRTQTKGKAINILDSYLKGSRPDFEGLVERAIKVAAVPAGEEQYRAVGGVKAAKGKYGAQPVDLVGVPQLGNVQVTTERLSRTGHHGIYGKAGKKLSQNIGAHRRKHTKGMIDRDTMNDRIAKEGLNYFKKRVPTWNKALAAVKRELERANQPQTAKSLSGEIRAIKSDDPMPHVSRMSTSAVHFQAKHAATVVLQALGNLQYYGDTGVIYSYQVSPAVYTAFGQFIMDPKSFQFKLEALNQAYLIDGFYDFTDAFYNTSANSMKESQHRAFAHNHYRITQTTGATETSKLNVGHAGGQLANHSRYMASIDMFHASKNMHKYITKGIIPEVRKAMKNSSQSYGSTRLSKHRDRVPMKRGFAWALPYISVFDTKLEKFGQRK